MSCGPTRPGYRFPERDSQVPRPRRARSRSAPSRESIPMTAERILVPLAEGFEEIEAVAIIDVLRRAELEVVVAGLGAGPIRGSHGISIETDAELDDVDVESLTAVCLPGGMPGTTHLAQDERILAIVRRMHEQGRPTAAICAAPMVLAQAGIVTGVDVTSHPSVVDRLGAAHFVDGPRIVESGHIVTSRGPGTAIEFALALVRRLRGEETARQLASAMLVEQAGASSPAR